MEKYGIWNSLPEVPFHKILLGEQEDSKEKLFMITYTYHVYIYIYIYTYTSHMHRIKRDRERCEGTYFVSSICVCIHDQYDCICNLHIQ